AVSLRDADVVLERLVRRVQGVLKLVPLEQVVVGPRIVGRPVLQVDRAPDRPEPALLALDPDLDALGGTGVVATLDDTFGKPARPRPSDQGARIQSLPMGEMGKFFRSVFSFLGTRSTQEERVAAYVIREHERGRALDDILEDPYVRNRCSSAEVARVLDR